jgi:hypothetical protein
VRRLNERRTNARERVSEVRYHTTIMVTTITSTIKFAIPPLRSRLSPMHTKNEPGKHNKFNAKLHIIQVNKA